MSEKIKLILLSLCLLAGQIAFSQTDKEKALQKGQEAIKLMDNGNIDRSIALLEEAKKLDPDNFIYAYEIALANYLNKDYKKTVRLLKKLKNHKDINERYFQLLGNSYDLMGKPEKALKAYDNGLEKFPNSGMIMLEKGNVYLLQEEYDQALSYYEQGIKADPQFPSNYYRATLMYLNSTEEVWGMIYGEIFMNLERNSARTVEISRLLYNTYKSEIEISSDTSASVSFCQNANILIKDTQDSDGFKLPFEMTAYEFTLMIALQGEDTIDMHALDRIRQDFVSIYYKNDLNKKYPNVLFDYQKKVLEAGHMEAYNHWILMKGDEEAFHNWHQENQTKWDDFVNWFTENSMEINESKRFYSKQYLNNE
ncbi:MAG: tetratricopeptide repeat protein [Bacteroidales bacterium]